MLGALTLWPCATCSSRRGTWDLIILLTRAPSSGLSPATQPATHREGNLAKASSRQVPPRWPRRQSRLLASVARGGAQSGPRRSLRGPASRARVLWRLHWGSSCDTKAVCGAGLWQGLRAPQPVQRPVSSPCSVAAERVDMETSAPGKKPWWIEPENFHAPMVFYLEEAQEELIFGQSDTYLRCIEVHSYTLIQLESWFTPTGQTRVTVVGPYRARQWLFHMMSHVISQDSYHQAQGLKMLERVRSQPLSEDDLETPMSMEPNTGDLSLAIYRSGTMFLRASEASPSHLAGCSGLHLSSLY
ncbi:KH homology domain-containing protein 1-like [Microcebus murinus]|uniref:KH homology domain-containing protein 1-like n=1 Tax=Microcebus murinus TaxID=30608 RepID=UPI003F6CB43C